MELSACSLTRVLMTMLGPQDARGFIENTLVKVPYRGRSLFFRVLAVDHVRNAVRVRLERFTLFWQTTDIAIAKGALLHLWRG